MTQLASNTFGCGVDPWKLPVLSYAAEEVILIAVANINLMQYCSAVINYRMHRITFGQKR